MSGKCPCLFLAILVALAGSSFGQINIFTVANGDVAGLKNALNNSNTDGRTDIINLATNGTYTLTAVDNLTNGANGLPVIGADNSHSVVINGNGSTITRSGSIPFRILQIATGANITMNNLAINNGLISNFALGTALGAGIFNNGTLNLTSCSFTSNVNQGQKGGDGISVEVDGNNGDSVAGGAICNYGPLIATSCTFTNNTAAGGAGGNGYGGAGSGGGKGGNGGSGAGGAISLAVEATLNKCTFTNNATANGAFGQGTGSHSSGTSGPAQGGAIAGSSASLETIHLCNFSGNSAYGILPTYPGTGGAISGSEVFYQTPVLLNVSECDFSGNHSDIGGAVLSGNYNGCSFESNGANNFGGAAGSLGTPGFLTLVQSTSLIDCTFYQNIAGYGGAVYSDGVGNSALTNCTLVSNTAITAGGSVYGGTLTNSIFKSGSPTNFVTGSFLGSLGHNISDDAAAGNGGTGPGGVLNGPGDLRNTNPLLLTTSPQNNGGPTKTFAIGVFGSSPAINAGDDSYAPRRDQRGYFRTGRSDIGAYEYFGSLVGGSSIARSGNDAIISAEVIYGASYQLERKLNITDSSWQPVGSEFTAVDNEIESATAAGDLSLGRVCYHVRFTH